MGKVKYRMRVRADVPTLGLQAGDLVTWHHGEQEPPFTIHRRCDFDMGAVLVALNDGRLDPIILMPGGASRPASPQASLSVEEAVGRAMPRLLLLHPRRRMG
mgnify:CR=1 FL=1